MAVSKRTRNLSIVLVAVIIAAVVGWLVGRSVKSPADAAADKTAPEASKITVPVEERVLENTIKIRGTIRYSQPTSVSLAGAVGGDPNDPQVVTKAPTPDSELADGQLVMEVKGRPVFAFVGSTVTYRSIVPGATGDDVKELETALQRVGIDPGPVDGVFDDAAEIAVDKFYESRGYTSQGPTEEQRNQQRTLTQTLTQAKEAARSAEQALATGSQGATGSELLQLQTEVDQAKAAVPQAQAQADKDNRAASAAVAEAQADKDKATADADAADLALARAKEPGAINPDTDEAYTEQELAAMQSDATAKRSDVAAKQAVLDEAKANVDVVRQAGANSVKQAQQAVDVANARLAEAKKPKDTTELKKAVTDANDAVTKAQTDLDQYNATVGTSVPSGEMLFFPTLPLRINEVKVQAGAQVSGEFMTVSGSKLAVETSIAVADVKLVKPTMPVQIDATDLDRQLTGTIGDMADKPGTNGAADGRVYTEIIPDDLQAATELAGASVVITIPVQSTGGKAVLAVPLAALSAGGDGTSRVEVLRKDGTTQTVIVTVGLSAQGYAQVTPKGDTPLVKGDRVIVGTK